jgi:hypothetical protein
METSSQQFISLRNKTKMKAQIKFPKRIKLRNFLMFPVEISRKRRANVREKDPQKIINQIVPPKLGI